MRIIPALTLTAALALAAPTVAAAGDTDGMRATPYGDMSATGIVTTQVERAGAMPYYQATTASSTVDPSTFESTTAAPTEAAVVDDGTSALTWVLGAVGLALVLAALAASIMSRGGTRSERRDASGHTTRSRTHSPAR